jgi:hypothetical protein
LESIAKLGSLREEVSAEVNMSEVVAAEGLCV